MLSLKINIEGRMPGDLEDALDEVKRLVKEGCLIGSNENDTGSFKFDITGEEDDRLPVGQFFELIYSCQNIRGERVEYPSGTLCKVTDHVYLDDDNNKISAVGFFGEPPSHLYHQVNTYKYGKLNAEAFFLLDDPFGEVLLLEERK